MWQEEGCIMYEIFFQNFSVIILWPVFVHENLKKQKTKQKTSELFLKNKVFFQPCFTPITNVSCVTACPRATVLG